MLDEAAGEASSWADLMPMDEPAELTDLSQIGRTTETWKSVAPPTSMGDPSRELEATLAAPDENLTTDSEPLLSGDVGVDDGNLVGPEAVDGPPEQGDGESFEDRPSVAQSPNGQRARVVSEVGDRGSRARTTVPQETRTAAMGPDVVEPIATTPPASVPHEALGLEQAVPLSLGKENGPAVLSVESRPAESVEQVLRAPIPGEPGVEVLASTDPESRSLAPEPVTLPESLNPT
ncbi:MAG: hypothetical protein QGG40_21625, partial [Myxococcota bacterium]|nr:hypothetical protein [Myxococcota bacterium]